MKKSGLWIETDKKNWERRKGGKGGEATACHCAVVIELYLAVVCGCVSVWHGGSQSSSHVCVWVSWE